MEVVTGLVLLMLRGLSDATVTTCNAAENSSQCFVALGGTLDLKLINSASGCELQFKNNKTSKMIFIMKENKVAIKAPTDGRSEFFINNGTYRLTNVKMADSGRYTLEIFNSNGSSLETRQMDIIGLESHCNVTKPGVQYYGALGGTVHLRLVTDDIKNIHIILLIKDPSGKSIELLKWMNKTNSLNESIKTRSEFYFNNGTLKIKNIERSDAAEYSSETFSSSGISLTCIRFQLSIEEGGNEAVLWSLVAVVLVLAVTVAVFWIHWRRTPPQTTDPNESQELEYADITVVKKGNVRKVQEEVEYGQLVVLEGSRSNTVRDRTTGLEDTIYDGIKPGQ